MTFNEYQHKIKEQREIEIQHEYLEELLRLYLVIAKIDQLAFFDFDHKVNIFTYKFTLDKEDKFVEDAEYDPYEDFDYALMAESEDITYGMIAFNGKPVPSDTATELFERIIKVFKKIFDLEKDILAQEQKLDIFIVTDEETHDFALKLEKNIDILLNADIEITESIVPVIPKLEQKTRKSIIIYTVANEEILKKDEEHLNTNDFLIVIGPHDFDLLLYCGHLNVYQYLAIDDFVGEKLRRIIANTKFELQNKHEYKNNIIGITSVSGGMGTTSIAMNTADLLAKKSPSDNILFIDLSKTKAISNLFLTQNPTPKKTIIDLVNSSKYDIEDNLEHGLEKIRENFYMINGIQKQIDSDYLEQSVFIEKLLAYISKMSEKFNYVILDIGTANAYKLNTTIYDIVNELWLVSDMSLPQVSKLKTFFSLMKRAGLKEKLTFIMNKYDDTVNSISPSDVEDILNTTSEDKVHFGYKIPYDYKTMSHCWNYCELVTNFDPKSEFVSELNNVLKAKKYYDEEESESKKGLFSFSK